LTAALWNALLFQIIQVEAVLFGSTFEGTAWDEEPAGWHIASSLGTNIFQRISYAQLTLLLLPLSLGFVWCLLGRSKGNRILATLTMALFTFSSLLLLAALHWRGVSGQNGCSDVQGMSSEAATAAVNAPAFTLPPSADVGLNILPNIKDPEAVDPQATCPGYMPSNVQVTESSLTAELTLAGPACNVYGNDIEHLTLSVEIQADDRVHIQIQPRFIGPQNETWFILPEVLVPRPSDNAGQCRTSSNRSRMSVSWSNDPTFSFTVARMDTGDTLFSTKGTRLVYQDQFIEFVSSLPENYNLYGLGEVIHGFRLGNNLTSELIV
jgi:alpha-glucosidase